jgi:hypothetical protein
MNKEETWATTVTEVLMIFRDGLAALIPTMERAKLSWREGEAYDEWDEIAQSLFKSIVITALQWGLTQDEYTDVCVPAYGTLYDNYSEFSFLELTDESTDSEDHLLFHSFGSREHPLDTIKCIEISSEGDKVSKDFIMKCVSGPEFVFQHRLRSGKLVPLHELNIRIARKC